MCNLASDRSQTIPLKKLLCELTTIIYFSYNSTIDFFISRMFLLPGNNESLSALLKMAIGQEQSVKKTLFTSG